MDQRCSKRNLDTTERLSCLPALPSTLAALAPLLAELLEAGARLVLATLAPARFATR